jgi:hypothetical protein
VVEQDAVAGIHAVSLAVIHRDPVGVELGHRVGAARIKGRGFLLWSFLYETEKLGRTGLIEAGFLFHAEDAHRFEDAQGAKGVRVGRVFGFLETHRNVTLRGEVVDFVGLHLLNDAHQARTVGHVAVVQGEATIGDMRILIQMIDAVGIEQRCPALDSVYFVALVEQELGEISAVLAGYACNKCDLLAH